METNPVLQKANEFVSWCGIHHQDAQARLVKTDGQVHDRKLLDEDSKWTIYSNRLRYMHNNSSVPPDVCEKIEQIDWWKWDLEKNCKCDTCKKLTRPKKNMYVYLYIEKLVRKIPWPTEITNEELDFLKMRWQDCFGKLQEFCLDHL